jgi:hypothetical protein
MLADLLPLRGQAGGGRWEEARAVGQSIVLPAGWALEAHRPARRDARDVPAQIVVVVVAPGGERLRSLAEVKAHVDRQRALLGPGLPPGVSCKYFAEMGKRARQVRLGCWRIVRASGPARSGWVAGE